MTDYIRYNFTILTKEGDFNLDLLAPRGVDLHSLVEVQEELHGFADDILNFWFPGPLNCLDCGVNTSVDGGIKEYYMLHNSVWKDEAKAPDEGFLCIGCLEKRIERTLTRQDFTDAPINEICEHNSDRLNDRLYEAHRYCEDTICHECDASDPRQYDCPKYVETAERVNILSAEHFGVAYTRDGKLNIGGLEVPYQEKRTDVYVRRMSNDLSVMEIHMARHDGLAQEVLDRENEEAQHHPLGPEDYWKSKGYDPADEELADENT